MPVSLTDRLCHFRLTRVKSIEIIFAYFPTCHLFNAKMECPYKDCVHGMTLASEADQAEGGGGGDEDMSLVREH